MKKSILIALIGLTITQVATAQNKVLTLEKVRTDAIGHFPANKQKELYRQALGVSNALLHSNLLPQLTVTGQATYQSEVTKFELPGSPVSLPQIAPDQYRVGVEAQYYLTAFSALKTQQQIEELTTQTHLLSADVSVQHLKEQVDALYVNVLLLKQNKSILQVRVEEIKSRMKTVASAVKNGTSLRTNLLVLQAEAATTQQRIDEISSQLLALTESLQILTGTPVDTSYQFQLPASETLETTEAKRPETQLYAARRQEFGLKGDLLRLRNRPQVYLFGQGNFGRPGYDFLNNTMRLYGIVGIGLNWKINDVVNQSRNLEVLNIGVQQVAEEETLFQRQLQMTLAQERNDISRYQTVIKGDSEIVSAREEIAKTAASQLENGAITSTEYLTELNALNTARLNATLHRVQLAMARENLKTTLGL
jgi:outer membrane protein TolC